MRNYKHQYCDIDNHRHKYPSIDNMNMYMCILIYILGLGVCIGIKLDMFRPETLVDAQPTGGDADRAEATLGHFGHWWRSGSWANYSELKRGHP